MRKSTKNRKQNEGLFGSRYKRNPNIEWTECFYCLSKAEDNQIAWDHCPPIHSLMNLDEKDFKKKGYQYWLIPSCITCNSHLGSFIEPDPYLRLEHLKKKYVKLAGGRPWEEDELQSLGPSLQGMIRHRQKTREIYLKKLEGVMKQIARNDLDRLFLNMPY